MANYYPMTQATNLQIAEIPNKWDRTIVTYSVLRGTEDIAGDAIERKIINLAMTSWELYIPLVLKYVKASEDPDIRIEWVPAAEDSYFGKDSGILAYAGFPKTSYQGVLRFNDDKIWSVDGLGQPYVRPEDGVTIMRKTYNGNQTAGHETGHLLGSVHSDQPNDLMYPYYNGTIMPTTIDSQRIQLKYGVRQWEGDWFTRIQNLISRRRKNWN